MYLIQLTWRDCYTPCASYERGCRFLKKLATSCSGLGRGLCSSGCWCRRSARTSRWSRRGAQKNGIRSQHTWCRAPRWQLCPHSGCYFDCGWRATRRFAGDPNFTSASWKKL